MDSSAPPLKDKLGHMKLLLDDASHRLREDADIFTTTMSASVAMKPNQNGHPMHQLPPSELRRTIADISTIQSVLSCPIFNQIVNVTDSLDKLTYHLNLRPSIGPADIEFNKNGELVLAPPVEPASINNLINSQLDEYSNLPSSPQQRNQIATNTSTATTLSAQNGNSIEHQFNAQHQQQNASNYYTEFAKNQAQQNDETVSPCGGGGGGGGGLKLHEPLAAGTSYVNQQQQQQQTAINLPTSVIQQQRRSEYDTEKLLGAEAGQSNCSNGARRPPTKVQSTAAMFESAFATAAAAPSNEVSRGLYKSNGHAALNQMAPQNSADIRMDFETTRSMGQINEQSMSSQSSQALGHTNDMYRAAQEVASADNIDSAFTQRLMASADAYVEEDGVHPRQAIRETGEIVASGGGGKVQRQNGKRISPESNARLADECDSGTSSFRSKGALCSPQSHKPIGNLDEDPIDSSIDQQLIEKLSPEMERIKVTLEKDSSGLGITIAGYMCEQEEISGIFIKSITPGSPADRSGKIRVLDQIFAVNGQEILGYSNPQAVNVLRQQSRVVTLDLMRYLAESKYKKLQTLLEHAAPSAGLQKSASAHKQKNLSSSSSSSSSDAVQQIKAQPVVSACSPKRAEPQQPAGEAVYNNSAAFAGKQKPRASLDGATSPVPVAAQRTAGATASKVIETKQGARNKIDIRSPLSAPANAAATATYANDSAGTVSSNNNSTASALLTGTSSASISDRPRKEWASELGQLEKLEWAKSVQIVELRRESTQSLGFTIKDYANPENLNQSIFMIVSITPGGIADQSGQLSIGDLLKFVDDTNLENSTPSDAARALRRTSDQVRLGILKYMRN